MAEGLLRHLAGDRVESLSAGARPAGFVHPLAIAAMRKIGLDISCQTSKSIRDFLPPVGSPPDLIISVCDAAAGECPTFPGKVERLHWPFADPGHVVGSEEQRLAAFCRIRDEIRSAIEEWLKLPP